jgi:hypothetical protein
LEGITIKNLEAWFKMTLIEVAAGMVVGDMLLKHLNAWVQHIPHTFQFFQVGSIKKGGSTWLIALPHPIEQVLL